jgi:hypothetical protein
LPTTPAFKATRLIGRRWRWTIGGHSSTSITENGERQAARLALVEEHVRRENQHDLDDIMGTFGDSSRYDEEPWDDHHVGRDAVRAYYDGLLRALPDPAIEVRRRMKMS